MNGRSAGANGRARPGGDLFGKFLKGAEASSSGNMEEGLSGSAARIVASVATALWRVKRKLDDVPAERLPEELRHLPRHLQAAWDTMSAEGIEVLDFTDKPYKVGMTVKPIAFQPTPGIGIEVIQETITPSVVCQGKTIQRADVIVACPEDKGSEAPGGDSNGEACHDA